MEILNEMKVDFLSRSNNESFARITVAAFVSQLDPTISEITDIKTAVSEAVTNAAPALKSVASVLAPNS